MENCVFCAIINQQTPGAIVFENDKVLALTPLNQVSKGHTLVIPKMHYENIFDIDGEVLKEVISVTKELSIKFMYENSATGVNILNASGRDAQQSVFHFHFHVVPRHAGDGLDMWIKQGLA